MRTFIAPIFAGLSSLAIATPDPLITPAPALELHLRQQSAIDPSLLGWVSTSGASAFSDLRSCDYPATLSFSGSFAQCCSKDSPCNFFSTCSDGNLIAESTSVFCDNGYCNTGLIVASAGYTGGAQYLGCWATSLGKEPFALVQTVNSSAVATGKPTITSGSVSESESGSGASRTTAPTDSSPNGSTTGETTTKPTGAGVGKDVQVIWAIGGAMAGLTAMF
ncbi:uncharacterized protein EI97DRAFT_464401 [Westerdykella ornata]|uniref:Extracellular membrane protein CFEM domain-containing protein n=1 Tax=Westerdykella ornata TaxID=318751 RepID=A0A6A6JW49_WESOR|nr:uncharacterized protein EI97DRAFT_464401 [Westerdykella ornata]KAF2280455.1 hypothetical protein EI97DRAFT_464401 [Westerdykella ornata]